MPDTVAEALRTVASIVQVDQPQNLQTVVWEMVGPTYWRGYAFVSAFGALFLAHNILQTVRHHERVDALTFSRMIWLGGLILGAFVRFNSACEPLSGAFLVTAAAFTAILISSRWCERTGRFWPKVLGVIRDAIYRPHRAPQRMAHKH